MEGEEFSFLRIMSNLSKGLGGKTGGKETTGET